MKPTKELFALWKKFATARFHVGPFVVGCNQSASEVDALLLRPIYDNAPLTHGFCKELVEHGENLWTFVDVDGIRADQQRR